MSLPNDIARCKGRTQPGIAWQADGVGYLGAGCDEPRPPCVSCRRRTDPGEGDHVAYMAPPQWLDGACPDWIAPLELSRLAPEGGA